MRFAVVGGSATILYLLIALYLVSLTVNIAAAHVAAYVISLLASYLLQKAITFRIKGDYFRTGAKYLIATALIAGMHFLLVVCLNHFGLNPRITLLAGACFYPAASFVIHSVWTFRAR